jgi:hypothetical protein
VTDPTPYDRDPWLVPPVGPTEDLTGPMPGAPIRRRTGLKITLIVSGTFVGLLTICCAAALIFGSPPASTPIAASLSSTGSTATGHGAVAAPTTQSVAPRLAPTVSAAAPATLATPPTHASTTHTTPPRHNPPPPPNLCGAPSNPYGYNFCGGSVITNPAGDICGYISCILNFWNGHGYVVECGDTMFSLSGGIQGVCSHHQGYLRTLYQ